MPFLKFRCTVCHKVFDTLVSVSKIDGVVCESCGAKVERAYEGACLFGMQGSSAGRGGSCAGNCGTCSGCATSSHSSGCQCGHCH